MNLSRLSLKSLAPHYGTHASPGRDWLILLSIAGLALIGIVVWSVLTFNAVSTAEYGTGGTVSTSPLVSPTSFNDITAVFNARATEEAKYVSGAYTFTDPSK